MWAIAFYKRVETVFVLNRVSLDWNDSEVDVFSAEFSNKIS